MVSRVSNDSGRAHNPADDSLWGTSSEHAFWWRPPVDSDRSATVGRSMMLTIVVWFILVAVLMSVIGLAFAISG
ncbi:MAG: hypothetical protein ACR2P0_05005 [Acidimicrobiales bacterium]